MLEFIQEKLGRAMASLSGKGLLTEADVDAALRELRVSLLEADVALPAIKHLMANVRERAVGEAVLRGANPGQLVVKIVYDALVELRGDRDAAGAESQSACGDFDVRVARAGAKPPPAASWRSGCRRPRKKA